MAVRRHTLPRQVRIWHDGTSDPTPPWERDAGQK